MARYLELAEEAMREIRARRKMEKTAGGSKFCCRYCGAHFDTSVGFAKHQVNGCIPESGDSSITQESARTLPSCQACGSYALYREKSGAVTCETCKSSNKATEGGRDQL